MDSHLLATKLRIPPLSHPVVRRLRLIGALESGIPHYPLIHISAPAGYGKTTLLAQWAHTSRFRIAWLSLGAEDNDLVRFLRYLLAAWEQVQPEVRESPVGLLLGGVSPDSQAVLTAFINVASASPGPVVFVLDDYHWIEEPSIHQSITFLVDHLPPAFHFILAGRAEPPLPLARYRARRDLLEIRAGELQFLPEETADFLTQLMRLELSPAEVMALQDQLEGWIAGLQLAALTLRRGGETPDKRTISGRHRFIADYLSEEVLAQLPEDMQRFLLQTSLLDRLCGPLCDAVTGKAGGQVMLETLERENLFLVPLDDGREWFRYQQVFAGFLHEELVRRYPDQVADLHRRAAGWYLSQDLPEPAFHHAAAGQDVELVLQIFRSHLVLKLFGGEITVVKGWLAALPEVWYAGYPELAFFKAVLFFFAGQFEDCAHQLDEVEQLALAQSLDIRSQLARVTALRCFIACFHNDLAPAEILAHQALQDLAEEDLNLRHGLYGSLGDTYRRHGRWKEARECYLKSLEITRAPVYRIQSVDMYGALADLDLRQGRLQGAASYWQRALGVFGERESWGSFPLPLIGWVHIRMGEILYEWNRLAQAGDHLNQGLERAELGGDVRGLIAGYLLAGRLKLAEDDTQAAAAYLDRVRPLVEQAPFPDWAGRFERLQIELWLAQDRLRTAVDWAAGLLHSGDLESRPEGEAAQLAAARVLVVKGDPSSLERALGLLARLIQTAENDGRIGFLVEALAVQALAAWKRGDRPDAMTSLERALRLAEPHGYVRLFADLGLPMARLLQEAHTRAVQQTYVEQLLAAFSGDLATPLEKIGAERKLPEPLTHREQEILGLIAAGLTNNEIAGQLVISPETVKKHTGSIFAKLGVSNRTEAVARARALDLFE